MASRRSRIKGMANIPQRRKPGTELNSEENVENGPKVLVESVQHNPIFEEIATEQNVSEKPHDEQTVEDEDPLKPTEPEISELKPPEVVPTQYEEPPITSKSGTLGRRKFIKPAVSIKSVLKNRNARDKNEPTDVESEPACQEILIQDNPSPVKKHEKIVILDEVITHAMYPPIIQLPQIDVPVTITVNPQPLGRGDEDSLMSPPPPLFYHNHPTTVNNDGEMKPPPGTFMPVQHSDGEYPIPPPSPSKLNRSRVRYTPRLGQRHSFSASESEDESRKHTRQRNDSVCSTISGTLDNSSISECLSPQKPVEFNSVIQRKCRRSEQSRKLAEARREFYQKFGNKQPDRRKLTMIDLIFYNPTTNPMSNEPKKEEKQECEEPEEDVEVVEAPEETNPPSDHDDNENLAPQIKIGPGGEIVLDEQSLVVENKAVKKIREEIQRSKVIDGNFDTGYGCYKKVKRAKDWSKHETLKFYKALNTIGTDFALMCEFFPRRDRRELKMKFKKEEKINKMLIDKALMQPCRFDFDELKHEVEMEEKQLAELEKHKEKEKVVSSTSRKRKNSSVFSIQNDEKNESVAKPPKILRKRKKKNLNILDALSDSDADISESEGDPKSDEASDCQPKPPRATRFGRIPKTLNRYQIEEPKGELHEEGKSKNESKEKSTKSNPGDLMVVPSTGPTGDLVYKVFMVTGNAKSNDNAKKGVDSIFTLTTSISKMTGEEQNDHESDVIHSPEAIEEENVTICEDVK